MNQNILWNQLDTNPSIQIKTGIHRSVHPLKREETETRGHIVYKNDFIKLDGQWEDSSTFGSILKFQLTNTSENSIRLTRLVFPTENGVDRFLKEFKPSDLSFFRNGYQSWSVSRSYRLHEKPLRPWLQLLSLINSNLSNLPSNNPGDLSSEMFSVITNQANKRSFLVGQGPPFNQYFYIRLIFHRWKSKTNYLELVFDFGRKLIQPGQVVELDGIIMALGDTQDLIFDYLTSLKKKIRAKQSNVEKISKGWSSWYCYENRIFYHTIIKNMKKIKENNLPIDCIQIDDGYQKMVADWLLLKSSFKNKIGDLATEIKKNGYVPGIWIAPFVISKKSVLMKNHPEYVLKDQYGKPIIAGYNHNWGGFFYGIDVTNPRFQEYLKKVIKTIVKDWGFSYLKLDFLYAACLRGGTHYDISLSRAEIMKLGLKLIRQAAGEETVICGCGLPLSAGIGLVDNMRIGPDTAPHWHQYIGQFLGTEDMIGLRNSIRNNFSRAPMNNLLWINDPDCLIYRKRKSRLRYHQRRTQANALIITGGALFVSDQMEEYSPRMYEELRMILKINEECSRGRAIVLDLMRTGIPEIVYNDRGYLGIFNMKNHRSTKTINFHDYKEILKPGTLLREVWSGATLSIPENGVLIFKSMPRHSSKLFKCL